jgi:hypothetical protein
MILVGYTRTVNSQAITGRFSVGFPKREIRDPIRPGGVQIQLPIGTESGRF